MLVLRGAGVGEDGNFGKRVRRPARFGISTVLASAAPAISGPLS
jgi:hypothetical protein